MSLDTPLSATAAALAPPIEARPGPAGIEITAAGRLVETLPLLPAAPGDLAGLVRLGPPRLSGLAGALAAFEALGADAPEEAAVLLEGAGWAPLAPALLARGAALRHGAQLLALPEMTWQLRERWLVNPRPSYPEAWRAGPHGRHPLRPPKPEGLLYQRQIPWLGKRFGLRALDAAADLPLFHRWMNDPRVAAFFDEAGSLERHAAYLARNAADPHVLPVIGMLDDRPFLYAELYWARENRLGAHHEAGPWDRGWHVAVGEADARGRDIIQAWLPSLMHYMFLDEPRTQAILGEPRADHVQQLRNLGLAGFGRLRDFDFAHKRAALVRLERAQFFEARLWARPQPLDAGRPLQFSVSALSRAAQLQAPAGQDIARGETA